MRVWIGLGVLVSSSGSLYAGEVEVFVQRAMTTRSRLGRRNRLRTRTLERCMIVGIGI